MTVGKSIVLICATFLAFLTRPSVILAAYTPPFPPFSVEGNPEQDYYFNDIFPLFRYIRFPALKIYENRDRSRKYEPYEICATGDDRDYVCAVDSETGIEVDGCDGGPVDICAQDTDDVVYTTESKPNSSCTAKKLVNQDIPSGIVKGKCSYTKVPSINRKVKGTDFSANALTYPKLQNEANAFDYSGIADNPISAGAHNLLLDQGDQMILRLMVLTRAKQTKATLNETGEWPLGWVDWGYQVAIDHDLNPTTPKITKTLIDIYDELPGGVSGAGQAIVEADDDFFLTGGNPEAVSDVSDARESVIRSVASALSQSSPPQWVIDLSQTPLYPPSFRQGYIRPSICKWNLCCPGLRCPLPEELLLGTKRGLFYDISVSRAYNGALNELFVSHSLRDSTHLFKQLVVTNPLIRFASSASVKAVPSEINRRLTAELGHTCIQYVPWSNWTGFGTHIDYLDPENFLGPNDTCPDYQLQPELSKDLGGSYPEGGLSWLLSLVWGGKTDEVEPNKYHLITIPDAMGQSIQEIQQNFYNTRDTLSELTQVQDFNKDLGGTVDDETADKLYGKSYGPAAHRRLLAYYTCEDQMYSSQLDTSIEQYALGTRIGCDGSNSGSPLSSDKQCTPDKFADIISDSPWKSAPENVASIITNSAMFENGQLNPKLEEVYAKISAETGVPCEVLAGHHFEEATTCFTAHGNPETCSVANGNPVNEQGGLEATARSAANGLLRHPISNTEKLITAMSNFNGGGNSNCQLNFPGGNIPYNNCPRDFIGEDDPYAVHMIDGAHNNMYQLYCGDSLPCIPPVKYDSMRPGAFPVALVVHEYLKTRTPSASPSPGASSAPNTPTQPGGSGTTAFFPETCGDGALKTALGCLPYAYQPFVVTLLRFLIGISGAISLVVMLSGVIQIMTAAGDAKKIQSGRDLFFSATAGLLFLIFSVSILRIIAGDILRLVGF